MKFPMTYSKLKVTSMIAFVAVLLTVPTSMNTNAFAMTPSDTPMITTEDGWTADVLHTIGETTPGTGDAYNSLNAGPYVPVGILDGLGAYELDEDTVRILANHELVPGDGYSYDVETSTGTMTLDGARVSYFDIDKNTLTVADSGLAINKIYDADGNIADDLTVFQNGATGITRLCSSGLSEAEQFGAGEGLANRIYFTGEETGGTRADRAPGGAEWALDPETGNLWQIPDMGRGAWENITEICSGDANNVAFILADDSSPTDFDGDGVKEAAPLYLYVGEKKSGDFLDENGLRDGNLYVWVADNGELSAVDFNTTGTISGTWIQVDNTVGASIPGITDQCGEEFDEQGYPSQCNLWLQAEEIGAFGFSRPEDVATNPDDCNEVVLASTGRQSDLLAQDQFGTLYSVDSDVGALTADLRIIYDGDADPDRTHRSPDNLDWADDGFIYSQEDRAISSALFGAENGDEANIVKINPTTGDVELIANVDRSVLLDPTVPQDAYDRDEGTLGSWETSGILDVATLFGDDPGSLLILNVQAHGLDDQTTKKDGDGKPWGFNPNSRLVDDDLKEGGQLLFLHSRVEQKISKKLFFFFYFNFSKN